MRRLKQTLVAATFAVSAVLGGCGGYDVELNGGIFDLMGVSGSLGGKKTEPKLAARPGLVIPPDAKRLPKPGGEPDQFATTGAWPVDPEQKQAEVKAARVKAHKEYCEKALVQAKANGDDLAVMGPMGRCDGSVLDIFGISGTQKAGQ